MEIDSSENRQKSSTKPSRPLRIKPEPKRSQHAEARRKHGLTEDMLKGVKLITPTLKQASGGLKACIEALRGDDSDDSVTFISKYDSIPKADQIILSLEEIAILSGITPRRLGELVFGAMEEQGDEASKLIIASSKPKVIARLAKSAQTILGEKDREMFLKSKVVDFFPQPKGINLNLDNRTQNLHAGGSVESQEDRALPPHRTDNFLLGISSALQPDHKELEAPQPPVIANIPEIQEAEYADI